MARHREVRKPKLQLALDRLGSRDIWSLRFLFYAAVIYGLLTFLMDYLRTLNPTWLWAVTYAASLAVAVGLAWLAKTLVLDRIADRAVAGANLAIAALVGGIKNFTVGVLALALGIEESIDLWYRFFGGIFFGLGLLISFASASGARGAHARALAKLEAIQSDLLGSRESLDTVLADEIERLQSKSRETILPKIQVIAKLLGDDAKTNQVVQELTETLQNRIRPLMQEIGATEKARFSSLESSDGNKFKVQSPRYFESRNAVDPVLIFLYGTAASSLILLYFQGLVGFVFGLLAGLLFALVMAVLRVTAFPRRETPRLFNYSLVAAASAISAVPGLFLVGQLPLTARESVIVPIIVWCLFVLAAVILAPLLVLDKEREKLEAKIELENAQLAKEITIFEQKLWVFKRRWLMLLHGTVQSALTAALTRLQTFSDSDPYQASLVRSDLQRAEDALQTLPSGEIDFEFAVEELKEAWAGVCTIKVDVDMRAERALKLNHGTAYCVHEIIKEAVGNAVRHGSANAVQVSLTRTEDDLLDVKIQNNGTAPRKSRKRGIGSRMMDDITLEWSIARTGKVTTLQARLPI